jgi:hypothetical protein
VTQPAGEADGPRAVPYAFVITTPDAPWPLSVLQPLPDAAAAGVRARQIFDELARAYPEPADIGLDVMAGADIVLSLRRTRSIGRKIGIDSFRKA